MYRCVKIKVCGLTREEDVDLALSLGADYCGFIVYPKSPRGISPERASELAARVPEGKRVLVDVETRIENLALYRHAGFDFFQIHHSLTINPATLAAWSATVGKDRLWLAPRVAHEDAFPEGSLVLADTILVDTFAQDQVGGTGQIGDWARFNQLKAAHPQTHWILAGGLSPANVSEAIASTDADHLDINSGVESAPGVKDAAKLREVFRILRQ